MCFSLGEISRFQNSFRYSQPFIRCQFPKSKCLAEVIRALYGNHVLKLTREYEKLHFRIRFSAIIVIIINTIQGNP